MKYRQHHNNKGYRQIRRGKTVDQVKRITRKLNIPYKAERERVDAVRVSGHL